MAFFADSKLRKVPVTGGAVVTLADVPTRVACGGPTTAASCLTPNNLARACWPCRRRGGPDEPYDGPHQRRDIPIVFPRSCPNGTGVLYTASPEVDIGCRIDGDGPAAAIRPAEGGRPAGAYYGRYVSRAAT